MNRQIGIKPQIYHILLDLLDQAFCARIPHRTQGPKTSAEQIKDVLNKHLEKPIRLSDISFYFCKSPRQIQRIFSEYYGVTICRYLQDRRYTAACMELRQSNDAIHAIAARFHLPAPGIFAREFQRRYGMLPSEYRNRFRDGQSRRTETPPALTIYDYIPYHSPKE